MELNKAGTFWMGSWTLSSIRTHSMNEIKKYTKIYKSGTRPCPLFADLAIFRRFRVGVGCPPKGVMQTYSHKNSIYSSLNIDLKINCLTHFVFQQVLYHCLSSFLLDEIDYNLVVQFQTSRIFYRD